LNGYDFLTVIICTELTITRTWYNLTLASFVCIFYFKLLSECKVSYRAVQEISLLVMSFFPILSICDIEVGPFMFAETMYVDFYYASEYSRIAVMLV